MIETHGIVKRFGRVVAVDHVSFAVPDGAVCGFLGPNGAGKTTSIRMIVGVLAPDEGSVTVAGLPMDADARDARRRIPGYRETVLEDSGHFAHVEQAYETLRALRDVWTAQLPGVQVVRRRDGGITSADQFLTTFGKPPRLQSCDCERSDDTTLSQAFQSISGTLVHQLLTESGNRLDVLVRSKRPIRELVIDLYWISLSRPPTDDEIEQASRYIERAESPRAGLEDVAWGLLNSYEFVLRR